VSGRRVKVKDQDPATRFRFATLWNIFAKDRIKPNENDFRAWIRAKQASPFVPHLKLNAVACHFAYMSPDAHIREIERVDGGWVLRRVQTSV
jgi:hypothetical protein